MTAATAAAAAQSDGNEIAEGCPPRAFGQHPQPLHHAPSLPDILKLKRQRVKSLKNIADAQQDVEKVRLQQCLAQQHQEQRPNDSVGAIEHIPKGTCLYGGSEKQEQAKTEVGVEASLWTAAFTQPLLPSPMGEPMSGYFQRLRGSLAGASSRVVLAMELDGVYLHKRPIRGPNGASPMAVCGSVLHHAVVYVKQGPLLCTLDFGPDNGADVTANPLEEAPAKRVLSTTTTSSALAGLAPVDAAGATSSSASIAGAGDELPYLYLGPAAHGVDHPLVQQVITFAESRPYHALRNNCIHFADALVRVMTAGAVRSAPLLYDMACGSVPAVDNPMLLMMQLMLRMSWFIVVDGSPLAAAFLEHRRATGQQQQQLGGEVVVVTAAGTEDRDSNVVVAAAAAAGPTDTSGTAAVATEGAVSGGVPAEADASSAGAAMATSQEGAQTVRERQQKQQEEEERENDHAVACEAAKLSATPRVDMHVEEAASCTSGVVQPGAVVAPSPAI